jgi:hypothetical protein
VEEVILEQDFFPALTGLPVSLSPPVLHANFVLILLLHRRTSGSKLRTYKEKLFKIFDLLLLLTLQFLVEEKKISKKIPLQCTTLIVLMATCFGCTVQPSSGQT